MFRVILHDFQMLRERRDVDVVDTLPGLDVPEVAGVLLVRRRHRVPLCAQLRRLRADLPAGVGAEDRYAGDHGALAAGRRRCIDQLDRRVATHDHQGHVDGNAILGHVPDYQADPRPIV